MIVHKSCNTCKKVFSFHVSEESMAAWLAGEAIQHAMPNLTSDLRELMISGMCGLCFDKLFAEEGDE